MTAANNECKVNQFLVCFFPMMNLLVINLKWGLVIFRWAEHHITKWVLYWEHMRSIL